MGISGDIVKEVISVLKANTTQKIVGAFVQEFVDDNEGLMQNQVVVNAKPIPRRPYTFSTEQFEGDTSLMIDFYAKTAREITEMYDEVSEALSDNRDSLRIKDINIGEADIQGLPAGAKAMVYFSIPVSFKYQWSSNEE